MPFSDKLMAKVVESKSITMHGTCSKCNKYFINLNIDGRISIYVHICVNHMKNMEKLLKNLVNVNNFNKYPMPPIYNNKYKETIELKGKHV